MGDSTCFMQPFSYASGLPNPDVNQGNPKPIHSLGESVSFGRFMSESLAWEKWSSFSQKRYVEEAERYAQPGSVAQKKAFFEAHYKRIAAQKAAALLEQENAANDENNNNNLPDTEVENLVCDDNGTTHDAQITNLNPHDSQVALLNSHVAVIEELKIKNQDTNNMVNVDSHDSAVKEVDLDSDNVVRADIVIENEPLPRSSMNDESPSYSENVEDKKLVSGLEDCGTSQMEKPLLKHQHLKFTQDIPPSARKRNAVLSSIRSSVFRKASKVPPSPAKSMASVHPRKENFVTPRVKKPLIDSIDKRKSTPRCLHRFMNSTPVKEPVKSTIPSAPKIEGARIAPSAWKAPKDCATPLKTPTKEYVNMAKKHSVTTPKSENRRTCKLETPVRPEASGSKTTGPKWHILSAVSKSFTACRNKLQSPNISTPFILRTEERAARRKQKLEERFNDKEVQKVQLQTKLKEKAETEFRKLRQSLCFKARPLPDFYKEREVSNHQIKKTPRANPTSRTLGKKAPSKVQGAISSPASMNSSKKNSSNDVGKNNPQTPTRSPSLAQFFTRENTSPNIYL